MNTRLQRTRRILAAVESELDASHHAEGEGNAAATPLGWLPHGNTGGANVSAFRPMPIPPDLQQQIDAASH